MMRCHGDCCRAFPLSLTYGELLRGYDAWRAGATSCVRHGGGSMGIPTDVHLIAPMVRLLGIFDRNPVSGKTHDPPRELFSCVHLQPDGDCGIYERRPRVCRIYPTAGVCEYPGCPRAEVAALDDCDLELAV